VRLSAQPTGAFLPVPAPPAALQVDVLSSRPELVTGGKVLIRTTLANPSPVTAALNGAAVRRQARGSTGDWASSWPNEAATPALGHGCCPPKG
jgi:hypothetical protein